jgi:hypothetical protein
MSPMLMIRSCNSGMGIERRETMNPSLWTPTYIKRKPLSSPSCGARGKKISGIHLNKKSETLRQEQPWESDFSAAPRQSAGPAPVNPPTVRREPRTNGGEPLRWFFPRPAAFRSPILQGAPSSVQRLLLHSGLNLCKGKIEKMIFLGRDISCSILLSRRLEL